MLGFLRKLVPSFLVDQYHFLWSLAGALLFGFPSRKIKVIGVTGTNGKSTTIELIIKVLEQAGYKVAALSSIKFKIGERERINELRMTMPGRTIIQAFLKKAVDSGCQYAIIEVTSEGIKQHRHRFINFEVAVFTNLSPEHIESHGSFEKYKQAKLSFFKKVKKVHVLNRDDESFESFNRFFAQKKYLYGLGKIVTPEQEIKVNNHFSNNQGIGFEINGLKFSLPLLGRFNIYNTLAAVCVGLSQNISLETCQKALIRAKGVPGRTELVVSQPFCVFVDYAFTPNALEKVYRTIRKDWVRTKMICVLGACGGGRDKWKRPVLGRLAAQYCDEVVLTNEDPYDEDPQEIIDQIAKGTKGKEKKIIDRREAISYALKIARPNDVVIITGKGCEPSICLAGGKRIPWDDRKVVKEEFNKIYSKT